MREDFDDDNAKKRLTVRLFVTPKFVDDPALGFATNIGSARHDSQG